MGRALLENETTRAAVTAASSAKGGKVLDELVRSWDKNGDGVVNKIELRQAVRNKLGLKATNKEIDDMFDTFDADGGGSLDLKEIKPWLVALQNAAIAMEAERMRQAALTKQLRLRATCTSEAAEMMVKIEDIDRELELRRASPPLPMRFSIACHRKQIAIGVSAEAAAHKLFDKDNVDRKKFHEALKVLKWQATEEELNAWFDAEAEGGTTVNVAKVIRRAAHAVSELKAREDELKTTGEGLRKGAKSQQTRITAEDEEAVQAAEAQEAQKRSAQAKKTAAADAEEIEKRRAKKAEKERKAAEKLAFDEQVAKRRADEDALGLRNSRATKGEQRAAKDDVVDVS